MRAIRLTKMGWFSVVILVVGMMLAGCTNVVNPYPTPYKFIEEDAKLAGHWRRMPSGTSGSASKITVSITSPVGEEITFLGSGSRSIQAEGQDELLLGPGLYPFTLTPGTGNGDAGSLCGAMLVVNVDEIVALATFGKSEETKLFSQEYVTKSRGGVLTSYTIMFDNKPVIYYWLGDRTKPAPPGRPTVELDFSGIENLSQVTIQGRRVRGATCVLDVYEYVYEDRVTYKYGYAQQITHVKTVAKTHKIEINLSDGRKYLGYVRNLKPSAYAAFLRVPCAIPTKLFEAADKGTIAKYSVVHSQGNRDTLIAEIVFGKNKGR